MLPSGVNATHDLALTPDDWVMRTPGFQEPTSQNQYSFTLELTSHRLSGLKVTALLARTTKLVTRCPSRALQICRCLSLVPVATHAPSALRAGLLAGRLRSAEWIITPGSSGSNTRKPSSHPVTKRLPSGVMENAFIRPQPGELIFWGEP